MAVPAAAAADSTREQAKASVIADVKRAVGFSDSLAAAQPNNALGAGLHDLLLVVKMAGELRVTSMGQITAATTPEFRKRAYDSGVESMLSGMQDSELFALAGKIVNIFADRIALLYVFAATKPNAYVWIIAPINRKVPALGADKELAELVRSAYASLSAWLADGRGDSDPEKHATLVSHYDQCGKIFAKAEKQLAQFTVAQLMDTYVELDRVVSSFGAEVEDLHVRLGAYMTVPAREEPAADDATSATTSTGQ